MLALAPFDGGNGLVARAVSRLVTIASGLDPHGLGVPEVYWVRRADQYRAAAAGFASRTSEGVAQWLVMSCKALEDGAREAISIAEVRRLRAGQRQDTSRAKWKWGQNKSGRRSESLGASPASTVLGYQACNVGRVGWPRRHCVSLRVRPTQRSQSLALSAITQARNTFAFIAACSAWVLGNRAGPPSSGDSAFSSGTTLASLGVRKSFVLRDGRHIKT